MTIAPIILPPAIAVERQRDATSAAVLRYFKGAPDQDDAFEHLVRICLLAIKPYFLLDSDGRSPRDATRAWVEMWLVEFLSRYQGKARDELEALADHDEFRHLGHRCRSRLINTVESRKAKKNIRPPHVSLDALVGDDGVVADYVGSNSQEPQSSLTGNGFEAFLGNVRNVVLIVAANHDELNRLDLLDGLNVFLANADNLADLSLARFHAHVVRAIAAVRIVSLKSARAYLRKFSETWARELRAGNRTVLAIVRELQTESPIYNGLPKDSKSQTEDASVSNVELTAITESAMRTRGCAWDELE